MVDGTVRVEARRGFFPVVLGDEVVVSQAAGRLLVARGDLELTQSGAQRVIARGDVRINQGGAQMLITGGDVSISEGGAMVAVAGSVQARRSYVGFAIGRDVEISEDSTVFFGPRQAALLGAAAGLVFGLVARVLRRGR